MRYSGKIALVSALGIISGCGTKPDTNAMGVLTASDAQAYDVQSYLTSISDVSSILKRYGNPDVFLKRVDVNGDGRTDALALSLAAKDRLQLSKDELRSFSNEVSRGDRTSVYGATIWYGQTPELAEMRERDPCLDKLLSKHMGLDNVNTLTGKSLEYFNQQDWSSFILSNAPLREDLMKRLIWRP